MTTFTFPFETQFRAAIQSADWNKISIERKANYVVNYKRIKTINFLVTTYLEGRNNNHHDPRMRKTASTKRIMREHNTEMYYGK